MLTVFMQGTAASLAPKGLTASLFGVSAVLRRLAATKGPAETTPHLTSPRREFSERWWTLTARNLSHSCPAMSTLTESSRLPWSLWEYNDLLAPPLFRPVLRLARINRWCAPPSGVSCARWLPLWLARNP